MKHFWIPVLLSASIVGCQSPSQSSTRYEQSDFVMIASADSANKEALDSASAALEAAGIDWRMEGSIGSALLVQKKDKDRAITILKEHSASGNNRLEFAE